MARVKKKIQLAPSLSRRLRILAAEGGTTRDAIVRAAISAYGKGKPTPDAHLEPATVHVVVDDGAYALAKARADIEGIGISAAISAELERSLRATQPAE